MQLKIDPEFQSLIPPLSPDEFRQLEENILKDGCRDPLVYWNDTIIDGHNRFKICTQYGIKYSMNQMEFDSREKAIEWIIMNQFGRRNLQVVDRVKLSLKLEDVIRKQAEKRMLAGVKDPEQNSDQGRTNQKLSKIAGVSHDTIAKYKKVQKEGDEETRKKLDQGDISVNKAYQSVKKPRAQLKSEPTTESKIGFKTCNTCGKEKAFSEFYNGGGNKCRKCRRDLAAAGMTAAEFRSLQSEKDKELDEFYEKMKSPSAVTDEPKTLDTDPIIAELLTVLKPLRDELTRFKFMPEKEVDQETMGVVDSIITNINIIKSKMKEKQ